MVLVGQAVAAIQVLPLSVEQKTISSVPAYKFVGARGSMARTVTTHGLVSPTFTAVQSLPLSVERKTPSSVPAYRVAGAAGSIARALRGMMEVPVAVCLVSPVFTAVQVVPPSADRNRPLPVPAYRTAGVSGSIATKRTSVLAPERAVAVQWSPLSVERKTPPTAPSPPESVAAYSVEGVSGLMAKDPMGKYGRGRPVFTGVQWAPLSVERNMPPL